MKFIQLIYTDKIDKLIIECYLIPYQFFNNILKRVIKTVNTGDMMFNFQNNELSYFKVTKNRITSINITISFLKNISYIFDFNKEDINITLNFRKIK